MSDERRLPFRIVVSDDVPSDMAYLISGPLSVAGEAERAKRVAAGEVDAQVFAEILVREKKIAAIRINAPPAPVK